MKKYLRLIALLLVVSLGYTLSARMVYVTRHGQVGDKKFHDAKVNEPWLTDLGCEQAQALAKFLVEKKGFKGEIYASPLLRTIQTGSFTAKALNKQLILEPGMQEMAPHPKPNPRGMTFAEIEERFPRLGKPGTTFKTGWRLCNEDNDARALRVKMAIDRILTETKGDILLVGHGASVGAAVKALNARGTEDKKVRGEAWNCCLFAFELDENDNLVGGYFTMEYLPEEKITSNFRCPKIERKNDDRYMSRKADKLERLQRKGKPEHLYQYGVLLYNGDGVRKDVKKAKKLIKKAAKQDYEPAIKFLQEHK